EFISNNCLILPESSVSSGRHIKNKSHLIEYETIPYHSFSELNENDYIVHIDYGIGIYRKIETIEIDGKNQDFILIQYADDGQLFLPVEHLHKIQKYIGDSESSPVLYKLGGSAWQKVKLKAKKEIGRIAAELVELYARREIKTGIKFLKDTPWQLEFEEEFSWEETRDQLKVIDEVKKDMESEKVMDRLVCGDVGYGKTEIAVRAVFKSAASGYQSAALVPTTILASQHYNTFKDRFANYPFKVEELSRFKSKSEQKSIIKKLESGEIDVIIGTHRLLQKDIKFRKIGLLVIDEEQRFGVKYKEKIKQMKSNIDVLSMTATPIPRTLHMSLMGARDISVITTPPKGRIPIEVITAEDTDDIIKEAVTNELKRNGQIYFIHNRIDNIRNVEARLNRIIPEAKIAVIHGRFEPEQIEDAMIDFIEKKYDILLSTTIIENGLDIPNVNTLIITEADKFGLAQMYQIKGRIGRTNVQAYSYFLHKGQHSISDIAKKRLSMIAQHKELGAGFKIAMNDLEIRGAGNIIGTEQHGIIVDIGYELYCKLLAEMIKYLQKHNKLQDDFNVLDREIIIETKKSCYIPDDYISDSKTKIEIYKKLSVCYDENSLSVITGEIIDRFGRLPEPVSNLIEAVDLKIFAFNNNIEKILFKNDFIEIVFVSKDEILKLKKTSSLNITFAGEKILHLKIKKNQDTSELFDNLKKVLKLAARIPDNKDLI
ncbi:MAG TPA: transcription-repair coupling factor, partial [bacterium]|nr:transcription-repair coupling factor [bacterium]